MTSIESLSTEVVFRILHHLDKAQDVVRFGQVNRRMQVVSRDPILWRKLFIQTFLLQNDNHQRNGDSSSRSKRQRLNEDNTKPAEYTPNSSSSRNLTYLPSLQDNDDSRTDWYSLFRISRNWQTGSFSVQQLNQALKRAQIPTEPQSHSGIREIDLPNTIIQSTQDYIFAGSRKGSSSDDLGRIKVFSTERMDLLRNGDNDYLQQEALATFISPSLELSRKSSISAIAIDRAGSARGNSINLLIAYTNGLLSVTKFDTSLKTFSEITSSIFSSSSPIAMSTFSWPYLATCSYDFRIRIYRINDFNGKSQISLVEERRSYSCHWPACMRVDRVKQNSDIVRLSVAYSNHVYPRGWTVGLQEIYVKNADVIDSRSASAKRSHVITSIDAPTKGSKVGEKSSKDSIKSSLTSLSYEEPFVVVGSRDNGVFCFQVEGLSDSSNHLSLPLSIRHIRTLYGHTGSVYSVSLDGGRCISGGSDGSVRVWRMGDEELSIAKATGVISTMRGRLQNGLAKMISLRSSDGVNNQRSLSAGKKRKHSITEDSISNNSLPLTLAEIWRHHIVSSTSTSSSIGSPHVIRWVASAFDRIISVTSVQSNQSNESKSTMKLPSSSCSREAQSEVRDDEELVQIWNFV